ncbi:uncharacterized protein [Paramisgurnus dabryanus]|uniref:uncharacterized protein n=1 Tax=Paramisgurnus dabryanus TaxID=90735 RepID=UPI0031F36BF5
MEAHRSRISNLPFWDGRGSGGSDGMYETTFQKHFKCFTLPKTETAPSFSSPDFTHRDLKHIREEQTETASSFSTHQPIPVVQPKQTRFTTNTTNFKMHSDSKSATSHTTSSDYMQHLLTSVTKPFLPITSFRTNLQKNKYPEPTYRSYYTPHEVLPILKVKPTANTGVASTLIGDKSSRFFSSSYKEQFPNKWCPPLQPLIQHSSLVMGDQKKISDKQTTYSSSFRQTGVHSPVILKEHLLSEIKRPQPINLREFSDDRWDTTTSEEFPALKCDPIHLMHRDENLSSVFNGEMQNQNNMTTNQSFFPETQTNHMHFPVHVDGASIRTLSNVEFGRPNLSGMFYSTTSQEQFPPKAVVRPRPHIYPSGHVLSEQEPGPVLTTVQRDFVPINSRRQELSPGQLQQVKESHIKPQLNTRDFRTTHNEVFVPKPYSKASLENPPFQHISHMCF